MSNDPMFLRSASGSSETRPAAVNAGHSREALEELRVERRATHGVAVCRISPCVTEWDTLAHKLLNINDLTGLKTYFI